MKGNLYMDYLKIFKESLPVDQRDDYQAFLKQQANENATRVERRKSEADFRRLEKHAQRAKDILSNFLGQDIYLKRTFSQHPSVNAICVCGPKEVSLYSVFANGDGAFSVYSLASVLKILYGEKVTISGRGQLVFSASGKRSEIGPVAGALKKAGLNVEYRVSDSLNEQGYSTTFLKFSITDLEDIELVNDAFTSFKCCPVHWLMTH